MQLCDSVVTAGIGKLVRCGIYGLMISVLGIGSARAATVTVAQFGDQGWRSDDTRNAAGANLVGTGVTNAGKPGQSPTTADAAAIALQIQFVAGPSGSTYGGAVKIDGTSSNSGKSSISVIDPATGFGAASSLLTNAFSAEYEWYSEPNPSTRTLAFKLGIQSTAWGTNPGQSQQNGFQATRSGESAWDLVLVNLGPTSNNAWTTVDVDHDTGTWNLFRQAGNSFFTVTPDPVAKTLDDWANDATYGSLLFGAGAKITSVQFGLGSSQRDSIAYLDYLQTNLLNGGDVIDFVAAVPEPGSVLIWGSIMGLGMVFSAFRRKGSQATETSAP